VCTPLNDQALSAPTDVNLERKKSNSTSWYSRLSAEKKKEYLHKQKIARQQKKAAALTVQGKISYKS
jgi:hypothetical protein